MEDVSRRGAFDVWSSLCAGLMVPSTANSASAAPSNPFDNLANEARAIRARMLLREATYEAVWEKLAKDRFADYFSTLNVEHFDGRLLTTSVTRRFSRNWITQFYLDDLLTAAQSINPAVEKVRVGLRMHQTQRPRQLEFFLPHGAAI